MVETTKCRESWERGTQDKWKGIYDEIWRGLQRRIRSQEKWKGNYDRIFRGCQRRMDTLDFEGIQGDQEKISERDHKKESYKTWRGDGRKKKNIGSLWRNVLFLEDFLALYDLSL